MPTGTPIRLVRENGSTIELDAQSMVLTTTRKVGGKPLPFAGSRRIGMDLNMNSAMINIQGIISDDRTESGASAGEAFINFGKQHRPTHPKFALGTNLVGLLGVRLQLTKLNGATEYITFTTTGGSTAYSATGNGGEPTILVNTNNATATELATALAAYINAQLSTQFAATLIDEEDFNNLLVSNIAVRIDMVTTGEVLSNLTPRFTEENTYVFYPPAIIPFFGGATGTKKSAGDKAMDLYGILNNSVTSTARISGFAGGLSTILAFAGMGSPIIQHEIATGAGMAGDALGYTSNLHKDYTGFDNAYILGIQIPYNSMIQTTDGEMYTARNFFMPTGGVATGGAAGDFDKTSDSNTTSASSDMNFTTAEKAGIQGSVQKMDITYNAGETVYEFNMIFAPVDNLL
jgi:hypothetical protein